MRTLLIVDRHLLSRDLPNLVQTAKQIEIEDFIPIRPIEGFDKGILCGASWLNMID